MSAIVHVGAVSAPFQRVGLAARECQCRAVHSVRVIPDRGKCLLCGLMTTRCEDAG